MQPLRGVYNILSTPFRTDGELDEQSLRRLTGATLNMGVDGITILGVLGEAQKLPDSERRRVLEIVMEVKSARAGDVQIAEAYARLESGPNDTPEVWLHGMHIAPYAQGNVFNAEPRRKRKLLLRREQISKLSSRVGEKGYTLVPLKFYFTRGVAKLELGVGKGRKTVDKRRAITERETRRDLQKAEGIRS